MRHEQRRQASIPLKRDEQASQRVAAVRIDGGERLVEEKHPRLRCDRARERDSLRLAARKQTGGLVRDGEQSDFAEQVPCDAEAGGTPHAL